MNVDLLSSPRDTVVQVDPTGAGNYQTLVTLQGVSKSLQALLDDNQLVT